MNSKARKVRLGVLVSGGGTNLQAIIDATQSGTLSAAAEIVVVISNKKDAFALKRAEKAKIETLFLNPRDSDSKSDYFERVTGELEKRGVELVCLAGFLIKLEPNIVRRFPNRILNIHPALLPKFGGAGMYGRFVHEAVLQSGAKESGCTVHIVDEEYDRGPILMQRKTPVLPNDTPETLAARILKEEHILYPEAIRLFIAKNLRKENSL